MSKPAFLSLADVHSIPKQELGKPFLQLAELQKNGYAIAPSILLAPNDLHDLFHDRPATKKNLLAEYHSTFKEDFVSLYYFYKNEMVQIENIKGDANLIQTIQEIAPHIHTTYLLIQGSPQPSFSGIVYTRNQESNDKRHIDIQFMQGVLNEADTTNHQRLVIDIRTQNIIQKNLPQHQAWRRTLDGLQKTAFNTKNEMPSADIIARLLKLTVSIKRSLFIDQKIFWYVVGKQLVITSIEQQELSTEKKYQGKLLCLGTTLVPGFVQGRPSFSNQEQKGYGSILVTDKLQSKHLPALKRSNGVVVEQTITDQKVLQIITKFHIPTIVHAQFATKNVHPGQEILLDASAGKVFTSEEQTPISSSSKSLIGLFGGDPRLLTDQKLVNTNAYILSSNSFYAAQNIHPLALTSKQKRVLISELVSAAKQCAGFFTNWKYMPFSLSSDLRLQLQKSSTYETKLETNPSYGSRGLGYLLENQELLHLELEIVSFITQQTGKTVELVLPFSKTTEDVALFLKILEAKTTNNLNAWLHVTSFSGLETIISLQQQKLIKGFLIDFDYLASSWLGVDPQQRFSETELLKSTLFWKKISEVVTNDFETLILARNISQKIAHKLFEIGCYKLITTPQHLAAARMAQS